MSSVAGKNKITWEEAVVWMRTQPDMQDIVRTCYFDDPLEESAKRFYLSREWIAVQSILADVRRGTALDIGAGRGISSYALARDGWRVTALEPDNSEIVGCGAIRRLAVMEKLPIEVIKSFGEQLPVVDENFDLVFVRQVLHHARDLAQLCREIYRVLKPGGTFLAIREHVISRKTDLNAFLQTHPLHQLYGGENAFLLREYKEAMTASGLNIKRVVYPFDSDINLSPFTLADVKKFYKDKYYISIPNRIYKRIVPLLSITNGTPGRLFSFVCQKNNISRIALCSLF